MWFCIGDLMCKDEDGYVYFIDWIGDMFCWKGENVLINEVVEFVVWVLGIVIVNIYGVSVFGMDGWVGMVVIIIDGEVDFDGLYVWLSEYLLKYVILFFICVQKEVEIIGIFKYCKVELVEEGFDLDDVSEFFWFFDLQSNKYELLILDVFEMIKFGVVKF